MIKMTKELLGTAIKCGLVAELNIAEHRKHFVFQLIDKIYGLTDNGVTVKDDIKGWYFEEEVNAKCYDFREKITFDLQYDHSSKQEKISFLKNTITKQKELLISSLNNYSSQYGYSLALLEYVRNSHWDFHISFRLYDFIDLVIRFLEGKQVKEFELPGNAPWSPGRVEFKNVFDKFFLAYEMRHAFKAVEYDDNINYLKQLITELESIEDNEFEVIPTKKENLKKHFRENGFYNLEKVKILHSTKQERLIELIAENDLSYGIAMIDYLGFIEDLDKNVFTKSSHKRNIEIGKWLEAEPSGRRIKGEIASLSPYTNESSERYKAYRYKERVAEHYNRLRSSK